MSALAAKCRTQLFYPKKLPNIRDSMTAIKAVIFDFGDTLVSYPLNTWERQIDYIKNFIKSHWELRPHLPQLLHSIEKLADELNVENEDNSTYSFLERIKEDRLFGRLLSDQDSLELEKEILKGVTKEAFVYPDVQEGISLLRNDNKKVGIMSNLPWGTSPDIWRAEFSRHGFTQGDTVDSIVCCMDVGYRKPHPQGILENLSVLNVKPEEALFVGDNPKADFGAAMSAGVRPIIIDRGHYDLPAHLDKIKTIPEIVKYL